MQELKIMQEFEDEFDVLRISDNVCFENNLILYVKNIEIENSIYIKLEDAKQIISFLQNYYNI